MASARLMEELALRLLSRCRMPVLEALRDDWLCKGSAARRYTVLMALARSRDFDAASVVELLPEVVATYPDDLRLARGAAAFLQAASPKIGPEALSRMLERLPESSAGRFLREEVAWLVSKRGGENYRAIGRSWQCSGHKRNVVDPVADEVPDSAYVGETERRIHQ